MNKDQFVHGLPDSGWSLLLTLYSVECSRKSEAGNECVCVGGGLTPSDYFSFWQPPEEQTVYRQE